MSVAREHMADAILSMQDACYDDGLAYPEEMTALVLAWLHTRRTMGKGGEILIDAPEPDAGERSPGHFLLQHAVSPPPPSSRSRRHHAEIPHGPRRASKGSIATPLRALLAGEPTEARFSLATVNLQSLRVRCNQIGSTSQTHRLIVTVESSYARVTRAER